MARHSFTSWFTLAIFALGGCKGTAGQGTATADRIQGVGVLIRDIGGERLLDADVVAAGTRNITDASGHLVFDQELPGLFPVVGELDGYTRTGSGPPVETEQLSATLLHLAPTESVAGGAQVVFDDVQLELPDGSVLDEVGEPFADAWTLQALRPEGDERWATPGDAMLRYDDVLDKPITAFHPIYLQGHADADGERLDVSDEAGAVLRFTLPADSPVQTDWRVVAYSMGSQRWSRGPRVVVSGGVVEAPLPRFGWIAFTEEDTARGCIEGHVVGEDASQADGTEVRLLEDGDVAGARAWVEGGRFCLPMGAGSTGQLQALWYSPGHTKTGAASRTVTNDGTEGSSCGGTCYDVGSIVLEVGYDRDGDFYFGGPGGDCDDADDSVSPSVAYGDGSWCGE